MKRKAGLWIDHRKAVIVIISDNEPHIKLVISAVEKQPGRSGGVRSKTQHGQQPSVADDSRQREFTGHLNVYYDAVIACIRDAEAILIFGPGEAKGELKHRLEKNNLSGHIAGVETADKMTDSQIMSKVRKHFSEQSQPQWFKKNYGFGANKNHQAATQRIQAVAEAGPDNEILEFAIAREMEAYQLYMTLAERVASPEMRTVFEDLAKEELDHKEKLELEVMKTGHTVPATPKFNIPEHEYILSDSPLQLNMDYKDMLLLGIEKEEASFRIYIDLIPQVQNKESREVLLGLAEEEVKHKLRFETEYDLLLKKSIS